MFEVIKKLPVILALLSGEPMCAIDQNTGKRYKVKYSVIQKIYVIAPALEDEKFKFSITFQKSPF